MLLAIRARSLLVMALASSLAPAACGGASEPLVDAPPEAASSEPLPTEPVRRQGDDDGNGDASAATSDGATSDASAGAPLLDPEADGPVAFDERDAKATVASTGDAIDVHVAVPRGAGRHPLVVLAHGFQIAPSQYDGYLRRLASFGYVAMTTTYPTSLVGNDNPRQAAALAGAIDWALADAALAGRVDRDRIGVAGHSLGGKVALLAATRDARIKAAFLLDPVDSGGPLGCREPSCVRVRTRLATLAIPTAYLGETTDARALLQACAPAADNFLVLHAASRSPSLAITALGANHVSFLDDPSSCGVACAACNAATADHASVVAMARATMTAFFERWLRGDARYARFLTGDDAKARYVKTGRATIAAK